MKIKLKSPALLVIDMQKYFLGPEGDAFLQDGPKIIPNVLQLIEAFRQNKLPVIYTRHAHIRGQPTGQMGKWWNNKLPWEEDLQSELICDLSPQKNEPVIRKTKYSAFQNTQLESILRNHRVQEVILCGVMTHLCVETTARHAFMLDFQPIVMEDACASESKKHHEASLLNLRHGFAYIVDTKTITNALSP